MKYYAWLSKSIYNIAVKTSLLLGALFQARDNLSLPSLSVPLGLCHHSFGSEMAFSTLLVNFV